VAGNPKEAVELAARYAGPIQLLLTDVIMPGCSGKELAEELRLARSALKVLFTSGYSGEAIAHHGVLDAGVAFLQKPFTPNTLLRKIRAVLSS
jgi:two-component system, cell cycle sensor histidine kinase and response regulator CckA